MTTRAERRVVVFGGTGFLGAAVATRVAEAGFRVGVAARRRPRAGAPVPAAAETVVADIRSPRQVAEAVEGAWAVVNAVSLYHERGSETFAAVHEEGAFRLASSAAAAGAARLIHISGLGVDPGSPSSYVRARAAGEERAAAGFPDVTVLRPSALFGPDTGLLVSLDRLTGALPVFPLFGQGRVRLQPVHVGDAADAVLRCLADGSTAGATFELGGPDRPTYRALVEMVLQARDRRRLLVPVPFSVWRLLAQALSPLPNPPVTVHQLALLAEDNVTAPGERGFSDLGIAPRPLTDGLRDLTPFH